MVSRARLHRAGGVRRRPQHAARDGLAVAWVDEVNRTMGYPEAQEFIKELVHIIDRELDKLLHLRRFARSGRLVVIRANDLRRVCHKGENHLLSEVEASLEGQFKFSRRIKYEGKKAWQYVAETNITLDQPPRIYRQRQGQLARAQYSRPAAPDETRCGLHCPIVTGRFLEPAGDD